MRITDLKEEVVEVIPHIERNFSSIVTEKYKGYILTKYLIKTITMGGDISVSVECDCLHFIKRKPKSFISNLKSFLLG